MNNLISKYLKPSIIGSICLFILGLLLFLEAEMTISIIAYVIGGILVAIGTIAIIKFAKNNDKENKNELDIIYGIGTAILGIIVIGNPRAIASIIPFIIGIVIIISSASKLQYSLELRKSKNDLWKSTMILALITLFCGILLIFNPFKGAEFITKMVGLLILIYAILDILSTITIKRNTKIIQNAIEEKITKVVDADIIEDKTDVKTTKEKKQKKDSKNKTQKEED